MGGVLVLLGAIAALTATSFGTADAVYNKFYARFSAPQLDPKRAQGFWVMPRTTKEAVADSWAVVREQANRADGTSLWLRKKDYRIGLLFDKRGSVAGTVVSVSVADVQKSRTPFKFANNKEWFRQKLSGVDVYSTIAYYVPKSVLQAGGRPMAANTPTAPGVNLLRVKPGVGGEVSRLAVASTEQGMTAQGWTKQGCYPGQGYHLYEGLNNNTSCDDLTTYFPMSSPKQHDLSALGVTIWGTVSDSRPWLEPQKTSYLLVSRVRRR
ncbi:hypothetical protein ONE63_008027 [Megalurothrips usitatus]|uniref:Uncharacterized protein n=1 Tax=Megalurothrips usitatus TaxID=439358 RepID=A0AAV7XVZ1_9NEOP|nr:hypothetical protein ONE63_008027 [Megalurothrips usitatus]